LFNFGNYNLFVNSENISLNNTIFDIYYDKLNFTIDDKTYTLLFNFTLKKNTYDMNLNKTIFKSLSNLNKYFKDFEFKN
jgi:hypothetical protein